MNDGFIEISENIFLSGPIKRYEEFDADKLLCAHINGVYGKDRFRDEQYLIVRTEDGIHVVTGCTHCVLLILLKT